VRVLGKDVRAYERHALRESFSVVPQDVFLFTGTVLSNVAMSDATPDRKKAEEALARVGALELVDQLADAHRDRIDRHRRARARRRRLARVATRTRDQREDRGPHPRV